jgi:hypothetical protein
MCSKPALSQHAFHDLLQCRETMLTMGDNGISSVNDGYKRPRFQALRDAWSTLMAANWHLIA